mgnify:CR=1 FL=1
MDPAVPLLVHRFDEIHQVPGLRDILCRDNRAVLVFISGGNHRQGAIVLMLVHAAVAESDPLHASGIAHFGGEAALADAAQLASLADETPEGRSIVVLAKELFGKRALE